ncbi:hypothetical protein T484DRAFT_1922940, partial [Baffinella frigidus]
MELHGQSFNAIHVGAAWGSLARMRGAGGRGADGEIIQRLQALTRAKVPEMGARQVANILYAMAKMHARGRKVGDDDLEEELLARAVATAGDFNPQNVANLLWALATMGSKADARLLEWALATMGSKADARLLEAMQGRATATAGDFNPQNVGNLLWALACLDTPHSQVSGLMVESMAVRLLSVREQLSVENKSQMHQWLLCCDLHHEWRVKLPRSMQKVKEELGDAFRQAFA